jgi:hypothetical protein
LQDYHARAPGVVAAGVAAAPVWIVDAARTRSTSGAFVPAAIVTIVVYPPTRMIHFDGDPAIQTEDWLRIVRVALSIPRGLVWFDLRSPGRSNRPELVTPAESSEWYSVNARYRAASAVERERYRTALQVLRELAQELGLNVPTPWSDADALRTLFRALAKATHPDVRGPRPRVAGEFSRMREAFEVVREFHPS